MTAELVPFVFKPTGQTQYRCTGCGCTVAPSHTPGSKDCRSAADERLASIHDD